MHPKSVADQREVVASCEGNLGKSPFSFFSLGGLPMYFHPPDLDLFQVGPFPALWPTGAAWVLSGLQDTGPAPRRSL